MRKKFELFYKKKIKKGKQEIISISRPEYYQERFSKFMAQNLFGVPKGDFEKMAAEMFRSRKPTLILVNQSNVNLSTDQSFDNSFADDTKKD